MKASPIITAFNAGEFSPLMAGRVDVKYYPLACKKLSNFIPMPQGPARKRPATRYVGPVKDQSKRTWLRRFVFAKDESYILEFGHLYIRFYANHGIVGGGTPVEVVTPYTESDMVNGDGCFALRFAQSGDVLYIAHPNYPLRKLTRTGTSTFNISTVNLWGGPFKKVDPDQTITIYASANTGSVTLTASAPLFSANDVGRSILIEQKSLDGTLQWEAGKSVSINDVRRSDGKNYKAVTGGTTGGIKPTHSRGAKYDGAAVQWEFLDPGYGWCTITAFTSSTVVTATVNSRIPNFAVGSGNASNLWAWSEFSNIDGYPSDVTFFKDRLTLAHNRTVHGSVSGDFESFTAKDDGGIVTKDMAYKVELSSDQVNNIVWLAPMNSALLVGTIGEEFALRENNLSEAYGPGNIRTDRQSTYGSKNNHPIIVGDGVLFLQASGSKIYDLNMAESVETKWVATDVTILAEHILQSGVISMSYQQDLDSIVWFARRDGGLVGFTINRAQDVKGWHSHPMAGVVECVETIPTSTGDELWMIVRRTINGSVKRYVEYLGQAYVSGNPEYAFYGTDSGLMLDNTIPATLTPGVGANVINSTGVTFTAGSSVFTAGDVGKYIIYRYTETAGDDAPIYKKAVAKITSYTNGMVVAGDIIAPWPSLVMIGSGGWHRTVTVISGLDHLEGQTVSIHADGAVYPDAIVTGGALALPDPASIVHVGLAYKSVLAPMPIEAGAADGTAQGKTQRISRCGIRVNNTLGLRYGGSELGQLDWVLSRDAGGVMNEPPVLFTGDVVVPWPNGYTNGGQIYLVHDVPLPATVVALMPQITTQDSR